LFGRTTAFCSSRAFSALDCTAIASAMCSDDRGDDFRFPRPDRTLTELTERRFAAFTIKK
jgi:hypothetical protein